MQTRACPHCGAAVPVDDRFCGECGRAVDSGPLSSGVAGQPAQPAQPVPPPYVPPAYPPAPAGTYPPPAAAPTPRSGGALRTILLIGAGLVLCVVVVCGGLWAAGTLLPNAPTPGPQETELVVNTTPGLRTPVATRAPVDTPPPAGDILFEDDFADPEAGSWDLFSDSDATLEIVDGRFDMSIFTTNLAVWATNGKTTGDGVIMVDARWQGGPEQYSAGLIFRERNSDFYAFRINSLGQYSFFLHQNDEWIAVVDWTDSPTVNVGDGAENHLVVIARGDVFMLQVNGRELDRASEPTLTRGEYGVISGVYDEAGSRVSFDNFVVRRLPPQ